MLLAAEGIEKAWGDRIVLRGVDLEVHEGDVVGLVGANGCGKSTLLSILAGELEEDHGLVRRRAEIGWLGQAPELPPGTVGDSASAALGWHAALHRAWEQALEAGDEAETAALQSRLDVVGWDLSHTVAAITTRLRCPPLDRDVTGLSGGERRRVALARALLASPDLLLLDEPTNHLDGETVEWLQAFLLGFRGGVVLVTHDRYLLEAVATRIVEIEDGVGVSYDGSWGDYLVARAERQVALRRSEDSRLALIAREAAWAAKSPAARTTKQKARLDRLEALQDARPLKAEETFSLDLRTGVKFGRTFVEARGLKKSWAGRTVVPGVDLELGPGDRLGIVGPNGAGKSTLLGLLTGAIAPDAGTVTRGPRVMISVLDQQRTGLDPDATVFDAAGDGNTFIDLGGEPVHVIGFLKRFLFPREALGQRVSGLSGGERARLLLARMMLKGSHLLLLDEPTNDLDLTTLAVLEEALLAFDGACVVVTHDRAFLDRVCNGVLAFHDDGRVVRYADRRQWLDACKADTERAKAEAERAQKAQPTKPAAARKRSYKEQRELEELPARIEVLDTRRAATLAALGDASAWQSGQGDRLTAELTAIEAEIAAAWERWGELEG